MDTRLINVKGIKELVRMFPIYMEKELGKNGCKAENLLSCKDFNNLRLEMALVKNGLFC